MGVFFAKGSFIPFCTFCMALPVVLMVLVGLHLSDTMSTIHYKKMLEELESFDHERSDKTFSIVYDELDIRRKTGGKRIRIAQAKKCGLPYHSADHEMRGIIDQATGKKNAVHLRLIFEFNNQTVYW